MKQILFILLLLFSQIANADLSWEPSAEREDDSSFDIATELDGFYIYCGESSGVYPIKIQVPVQADRSYDLQTPVKLFCAMTQYDMQKHESQYSNEVIVSATELKPAILSPKAPLVMPYTIPDGYQKIVITITPVQ